MEFFFRSLCYFKLQNNKTLKKIWTEFYLVSSKT